MLFLHFLRIRARMSLPVKDTSRSISSMASFKSAWVNKMPLIFGPVLWQLLNTDTYCCGNQSFRMDYLLVPYFCSVDQSTLHSGIVFLHNWRKTLCFEELLLLQVFPSVFVQHIELPWHKSGNGINLSLLRSL